MANSLDNLKPFKKGESGNPSGRPKGSRNRSSIVKAWIETTEFIINPLTGEKENLEQVDIMTISLIKKAINDGDVQAYKELMDSAYGKSSQPVELTGKDGAPLTVKFEGMDEAGSDN